MKRNENHKKESEVRLKRLDYAVYNFPSVHWKNIFTKLVLFVKSLIGLCASSIFAVDDNNLSNRTVNFVYVNDQIIQLVDLLQCKKERRLSSKAIVQNQCDRV